MVLLKLGPPAFPTECHSTPTLPCQPAGTGLPHGVWPLGAKGPSGARRLGWAHPRHAPPPTHLPATPLTSTPVENTRPGSARHSCQRLVPGSLLGYSPSRCLLASGPPPSQCRSTGKGDGAGGSGPQDRPRHWPCLEDLLDAGLTESVGRSLASHLGRSFPGPCCHVTSLSSAERSGLPAYPPPPLKCPAFP